ncbi:jmjC domain-containing histone demethylation protein 1 isoform X2 [Folsomia candida]|uniref:jmjC domain-containing histone demethylation protein 1 isoform X2 n=1 Tax=Folsomia candida TaxID=158441 RepID=UPI001604B44A|nr:jmjC domain-containing histone demethylation protein 1 isoform X2 [Folsomia candida]
MDTTSDFEAQDDHRDRKERKVYTDFWALGDADDDIEGPQSFDLEEKLNSPKFNKNVVLSMKGSEFNLAYIQKHGFTEPLIFHNKEGLGIRIPTPSFNVGDVKTCVGSKRLLDVMDVRTQKNTEMTMKTWQEYYDKDNKDRLLNVISLEFSHTKLENFVEAPRVVRQLDWVDRVWPRHLKNMQTESTNVMDEMMYPKVQKYCLMSVKGCYTDFHVDFGGTSVWYHILRGAKVFWLIPPTDKNLGLYQEWVLSGKQGDTFFGDNVDICSRVYLQDGDTFFIPSGWIHAVYTPKDSLVFGGNFLHSFGIEKQLKIATVEEQTKVPQKFRYPFFTEMLWYTLERYVHCLLGQSYLRIPSDDDSWKLPGPPGEKLVPENVALSPQELLGLKAIVLYLHQLPIQRKNVPVLIYDAVSLLKCIRQVVEMHRYDDPAKAVTGKPILIWPGERAENVGKITPIRRQRPFKAITAGKVSNESDWVDSPSSNQEDVTKRRGRCGKCQACRNTEDCGQCANCMIRQKYKDSVDILRRKICVMNECMAPVLLHNTICGECGFDGWNETPHVVPKLHTTLSTLMECSICWKIVHPICIGHKSNPQVIAIVNDDLPNSWECPLCLDTSRPRTLKKHKSLEDSSMKGSMYNNNSNSMNQDVSSVSNNSVVNHNDAVTMNGNSSVSFPGNLKGSSITSSISTPFPAIVKEEKGEIRKSTQMMDKSARDDEDSVKQKLDEVVRRKSTEEAAKVIAGKMNAAIKRTLSTGSEGSKTKFPRRQPEEINGIVTTNNNSATHYDHKPVKLGNVSNDKDKLPSKKVKKEVVSEESDDDDDDEKDEAGVRKSSLPIKYPFRTELSGKIIGTSTKSLKKPTNVVRPSSEIAEDSSKKCKKKLGYPAVLKEKLILAPIFKWLDIQSLNRAVQVCKDWNRVGISPELWKTINLSHKKITAELLKGVVRRQPNIVILNWTQISKQQLVWLISRLPQLKHLSLQGNSWNTVSALKTCFCPVLEGLDLGYVDNLLDSGVRETLAAPLDSRPGLTDSKSRLRHLKYLNLSGAPLSDVSLRYVTQHAGSIAKLDLSSCSRITDAGIAQLGAPDSPSLENLTHLIVTGCPQITNISLDHLKRCKKLIYLDIKSIPQITVVGLTKFFNQLAEAEASGIRTSKMVVKHSLSTAQLELPNLHQNFYQSEMVSSRNSLTSPSFLVGVHINTTTPYLK